MTGVLLSLESVTTYYGQMRILEGISLNVAEGELVCLLGGNASGKSTTLKTILGIVRPRTGRVLLGGKDVTQWQVPQRISAGLAIVPENRRLFGQMTVRENLELGAVLRGREKLDDDFDRVHTLFPRLLERRGLLAARQRPGELAAPFEQPREQRVDPVEVVVELLAAAQHRPQFEVLPHRHLAEQPPVLRHDGQPGGDPLRHLPLRHVLAVEQDPSGARPHDTQDRLQRGRLARGVAAEQADHLTLGDVQRDPLQDPHLAVVRSDAFEAQQHVTHPASDSASGSLPR